MVAQLQMPALRNHAERDVMTATTTHLDPSATDTNADADDLDHTVCGCNPNRALCGTDVTNEPWIEYAGPTPDDCIVCTHLEFKPCQNCGE